MRTAALLACLLTAALPGDDPVIARAGDTVFHRSEYGEWLVERYGGEYVEEYVHDQLVLAEAGRRGLLPDAAQLEDAWQTEFASLITNSYAGDLKAFENQMRLQHRDVATYKRHRTHFMQVELAEANMARADRTISEGDLRDRYKDEYGAGGENMRLAVLFFSAFQRAASDDAAPDFTALREAARIRAEAARAALQAGKPLAELLPDGDRPASDTVVDGLIAHYRKRMLGSEVETAVASLDNPGDISTVVIVFDGCYVLQLLERRKVSFEEARPDLERALRDAPVTAQEYANVREAVVSARQPEILSR